MSLCRSVCVPLLMVLPIVLAGCAPSTPSQTIIGKWQTGIKDKKSTMTFAENGAWTFEAGPKKETGTYKFVADNKIEIYVKVPPEAEPIVYKRTLYFSHHDLMNSTDSGTGFRVTWRRVEEE
jgi:hypothetical protein